MFQSFNGGSSAAKKFGSNHTPPPDFADSITKTPSELEVES